jgi:hypothetical protein
MAFRTSAGSFHLEAVGINPPALLNRQIGDRDGLFTRVRDSRVPHNADDLDLRFAVAQKCTNRIPSPEKPSRQRFVHDRDPSCVFRITRIEIASGHDTHADGREERGGDVVFLDVRRLTRAGLVVDHLKTAVVVTISCQKTFGECRPFDAWKRLHAFEQTTINFLQFTRRVLHRARVQGGTDDTVGIESQVQMCQVAETPNEQAGGNNKQQRKRNLKRNKQLRCDGS